MTRKQLREMGITDEEQITAILNAHRGEVEDVREAARTAPAAAPPTQPQQPADMPSTGASTPSEVEQLRLELEAEKQKAAQRDRRDLIVGALGQYKPKNADMLFRLVDMDKVVIKDGKIESGLDEQITSMKTDHAYLFENSKPPSATPAAVVSTGGKHSEGGTTNTNTNALMNSVIRGTTEGD